MTTIAKIINVTIYDELNHQEKHFQKEARRILINANHFQVPINLKGPINQLDQKAPHLKNVKEIPPKKEVIQNGMIRKAAHAKALMIKISLFRVRKELMANARMEALKQMRAEE